MIKHEFLHKIFWKVLEEVIGIFIGRNRILLEKTISQLGFLELYEEF